MRHTFLRFLPFPFTIIFLQIVKSGSRVTLRIVHNFIISRRRKKVNRNVGTRFLLFRNLWFSVSVWQLWCLLKCCFYFWFIIPVSQILQNKKKKEKTTTTTKNENKNKNKQTTKTNNNHNQYSTDLSFAIY